MENVKDNLIEKIISGIYNDNPAKTKTSIRTWIDENLGIRFERMESGIYKTTCADSTCALALIDGNGRNLSVLEDNSIDYLLSDYLWIEDKRDPAIYYFSLNGFQAKYRALKNKSILIEMIPEEIANNWEYLNKIKEMAEAAGFSYYANLLVMVLFVKN